MWRVYLGPLLAIVLCVVVFYIYRWRQKRRIVAQKATTLEKVMIEGEALDIEGDIHKERTSQKRQRAKLMPAEGGQ